MLGRFVLICHPPELPRRPRPPHLANFPSLPSEKGEEAAGTSKTIARVLILFRWRCRCCHICSALVVSAFGK